MLRYIYPIVLDSNIIVSIDSKQYATVNKTNLFWIDYDHIKEELGIDRDIVDIMTGIKMSDIIGDPNAKILTLDFNDEQNIIKELFMEPNEDSKPRIVYSPIKRGIERYINCRDDYYHITHNIVEKIDMREDAITLNSKFYPITEYTSIFESIEVLYFPKGMCYEYNNNQWRRALRDIPFFNVSDSYLDIDIIMSNNKLTYMGLNNNTGFIDNFDSSLFEPGDDQNIFDPADYDTENERFYKFRDYSVYVRDGYTKIIPIEVSILPIMKIKAYKDMIII